jgi:hypothetical protein
MLTAAFVVALIGQTAQPNLHALEARRLQVSQPVAVVELSSEKLRGFPVRLSWSPDGKQLYVRAVQRDIWANEKEWHYVVRIADGDVATVDREPEWSPAYWNWKSSYFCPGAPALRIETESRVERKTSTNSGAGGSMAQNSGDPYGPGFELGPQGAAILAGAMQAQMVTTTTLRLKGRVLSEFVNTPVILGLMYGWAPEGLEAIAYAGDKRALVVMDGTGSRHEVRGTKGVLLPAWSADGHRIAWLSQQGRKKFVLTVAQVGVGR